MIIDGVNYLRTRMVALGYKEWIDGFNNENIPRTQLGCFFHIGFEIAEGISNNQYDQEIEMPLSIEVFIAPGRDNKKLRDDGLNKADTIITDILKASNRLTYSDSLKDIKLVNFNIEPLNESNDNGVFVTIEIRALIIINTA